MGLKQQDNPEQYGVYILLIAPYGIETEQINAENSKKKTF